MSAHHKPRTAPVASSAATLSRLQRLHLATHYPESRGGERDNALARTLGISVQTMHAIARELGIRRHQPAPLQTAHGTATVQALSHGATCTTHRMY